ncbi:TIGR04282 family arsenosugar biosynthesis glycosyltransferase [Aquimarina sp. AU474]|uniref:TIGR04282 family arsenosugar biosynthesis glycosyltransferase n=1 Tax=Aquimarina sp. AU474 TaxID=2108529 RepID=UPI000D68CB39|nr:TIGR04282 family arsenosugar biosynthesis glycosyltransferase [Aquimarina sp. AU474]
MVNTENLLLIFTRNPELGKCKTRLAATIGDEAALGVYKMLLNHTVTITKNLPYTKQVHYSVKIRENDIWDADFYTKKQQYGDDLGQRMKHAFTKGFEQGYKNIIIIGSDMYDLSQQDIESAFNQLETHDHVVGPAEDGGYYLLGMKDLHPTIFENKVWGTNTVLKDTLDDLQKHNYTLLKTRNDVDYYEDIKDISAFQEFLT